MGKGSGAGGDFPARRGVISQIPTKNGVYTIKLSALKDVQYSNFVKGRVEGIRAALDKGVKLPPLKLSVDRHGVVDIADGNHRLRVYRERGIDTFQARFDVPPWQGHVGGARREAPAPLPLLTARRCVGGRAA